jgi:phosphoglycerate dehydrogenase-like enzyme
MKKGAFLIDVSKGGIVKQKDVIWALKNKLIGGAALDVFEEEPLPEDSELWSFENVVITPHVAGITKDYAEKVGEFFCENLKRFIKGKELLNLIDLNKGY